MEYQLNAGPVVNETMVLSNTIYAEDTVFYTFTATADLSTNGTHNLNAWTAYATDVMNTNDTISGFSIKNPYPLFDTDTVTFENNVAVLDSTILWDNIESEASVSNASASSSTFALRLTGGDPLNSGITPDLDTNGFWSNNLEFAASAKFCVDATSWVGAHMQFDLRQTMSKVYALQFGQPIPQASSFRVVVNGTQIGGTFNPTTETNDPFTTQYFNLNAYAGTQFEVVLESRMGFSEAADPTATFPFNSEGDNAYVDNILFSQTPLSIDDKVVVLENVQLYPNPNNGEFVLSFIANNPETSRIEILDVLGNVVLSQNTNISKGFNQVKMDISNQANSVYFVKVISENGSYAVKRIVKK